MRINVMVLIVCAMVLIAAAAGAADTNEKSNNFVINIINFFRSFFSGGITGAAIAADEDKDGVADEKDKCPDTIMEYASKGLRADHYDSSNMDLTETYGCSCGQILYCKPGDNKGEYKFGCSQGTKDVWVEQRGWSTDCQADGIISIEGIDKSPFENTDGDGLIDNIDGDTDNDGIIDEDDDMIEDKDPTGDPDSGVPDWHPKSKHKK